MAFALHTDHGICQRRLNFSTRKNGFNSRNFDKRVVIEYTSPYDNYAEIMAKKTLTTINYLIAGLTLVSCIISISHNDIYLDGEWANAQWLGQDIITLIIALPFLLVSSVKGIGNGNIKWEMINCGILLYYAYTYSFFMFAAELTPLYLFHFPIYGLSVIGFVICCIRIFNRDFQFKLPKKGLRTIIIFYLVLIALMISFLWLNDIMAHLNDPEHSSDTPDGKAPLIIYSLDLAIIIPLMISSALLLYKQSNWGYTLSGIILTKTSTLGFALMAMALSMFLQRLNPDYFLIVLWSTIGLIGALLTILYLKNLQVEDNF